MLKHQKSNGFTLTEVLVSIAIVTIMVISTTSIFLSIRRIERHLVTRENMLNEVTNVFNVFSTDPSGFITNLESLYEEGTYSVNEDRTVVTLFYTSSFTSSTTKSNALICTISIEESYLYTLTLSFENGYDNFPKEEALQRTIRG